MSPGPVEMVVEALAATGAITPTLAWVVVATFLAGIIVERFDHRRARYTFALAWLLFGVFWFTLIHHFAFAEKSIVEGIGTVAAVPISIYVAVLLVRGRDSLFVASRAIGVMGLIFLPVESIPVLRRTLIETVTGQTAFLIDLIGVDPMVVGGMTIDGLDIADKQRPYWSTFVFYHQGDPITYTIVLACTGLGSMSIMGGLIAAVDAPLRRKAKALAMSIPIIYGLNLVRNVFIAVGFGEQLLHVFPDAVMALFAIESEVMVSYYVADRIIAQSLSVVAMLAITWLIVHELPEVLTVLEDALFVLTGTEYDLADALGVDRSGDASVSRPEPTKSEAD
ncbi:MAG TPA: archaeosortase A [Natrialbaceae archaeon]|nr:archaeosortase A [Natrialbaceae archaeon]